MVGRCMNELSKVTSEEYQSIHEIMVAFKGKSSLRKYLPANSRLKGHV